MFSRLVLIPGLKSVHGGSGSRRVANGENAGQDVARRQAQTRKAEGLTRVDSEALVEANRK
jgi:hypothetical protein